MTKKVYVTQANAERFLKLYFEKHGKPDSRNFNYLLNDQRRGRCPNPIPFVKVRGRIFYLITDLRDWAENEIEREKSLSSGIYQIEADTSLECLAKLSLEVAKHP
jgi:hypothetical protein